MLVEPLKEGFEDFYEEYKARRGCTLNLEDILNLVGPIPGALPTICDLIGEAIRLWILMRLKELDIALREALANQTLVMLGRGGKRVVEDVLELLEKPVDPLMEPRAHSMGAGTFIRLV